MNTAEQRRLRDSEDRLADWKHWGPYLSERAWGTVREDYSADGDAWNYFPHDHARSRVYRWNEDGLAGLCNRFQNLCLAIALWNERDPILKERLFGLTNPEGNHGEDVKEYYAYLDSTPTHSYMKMLYKYPQVRFPYEELVKANRARTRDEPECELTDLLDDVFRQGRYFDVFIEYAKADEEDVLCQVTAINRGPDAAPLHILPHLWFRNTWSWRGNRGPDELVAIDGRCVHTRHRHLGDRWWYLSDSTTPPNLLFTENETNFQRLYGVPNRTPYVKDGIHEAVVSGRPECVRPDRRGSKAAAHYREVVPQGGAFVVRTRLVNHRIDEPFSDFETIIAQRRREADEFYTEIQCPGLSDDDRNIQRQAFAGLMWSKQFYHYSVELWQRGDSAEPPPDPARAVIRNDQWKHVYTLDVTSMPDKWEYPWFAAWDLAFHCLPIALIDPEWAKRQLTLLTREWYMHPNGQLPAYEWNFGDVNPPVHAWAAWRVYKISRNVTGVADTEFLESIFHKLLLYFTWWVNRKDVGGNNIFQGGFLGLDNIGVFDRSRPLPGIGAIEQADGTAWMGMFCLNLLAIALELARVRPAYEDVATKFFEHFIYIANSINRECGRKGLWDEEDGFYYDAVHAADGQVVPLRVRSMVGLIPLFAVETIEPSLLEMLPRFRRRVEWFMKYRSGLVRHIHSLARPGVGGRRLLALVDQDKLIRILPRLLDSSQFLSAHGIRSLSRQHLHDPYVYRQDGHTAQVGYEPGESRSELFGGNSNWRGPVWFPVNYLLIESLQKYHHYYGSTLKAELPRYSERWCDLHAVAVDLSQRLVNLFRRDPETGMRPAFGDHDLFQFDPHFRDHLLFHEYFHGETGAGLGASHQTGWTALVAKLIQQCGVQDLHDVHHHAQHI